MGKEKYIKIRSIRLCFSKEKYENHGHTKRIRGETNGRTHLGPI
jgi:hypothetical protein